MSDIKDKIKKLLRLATSPNRNEAEAARTRAEALMEKHGRVTLEEDVNLAIDEAPDFLRERLARAAALSRGCRAGVSPSGVLCIRGSEGAAKAAARLYCDLYARGRSGAVLTGRAPPPVSASRVYAQIFWLVYVDVLEARLSPTEQASQASVPAEEIPANATRSEREEEMIAKLKDAARAFEHDAEIDFGANAYTVARRLREAAKTRAQLTAESFPFPVWPPPDLTRLCLPAYVPPPSRFFQYDDGYDDLNDPLTEEEQTTIEGFAPLGDLPATLLTGGGERLEIGSGNQGRLDGGCCFHALNIAITSREVKPLDRIFFMAILRTWFPRGKRGRTSRASGAPRSRIKTAAQLSCACSLRRQNTRSCSSPLRQRA